MIFSLRNKISTQILNRSYIFAIIQVYFLWGHTSRHKGLQPEDRPFGHYIHNQGAQKQS